MRAKRPHLLFMNELLARFWIGVVKLFRFVPIAVRGRIAAAVGWILWFAIPKRRHVTLTNLRLCFPELSDKERLALAHALYRRMARAALDHGVLWAGSAQDISRMVRFEGLENITQTVEPLSVLSPHVVGVVAAGSGLNLHVRGCSLYQKQSNAAWDAAALAGRKRFADPVLIAKTGKGDLMAVIRAMHQGLPFYYLPDLDHGRKNSIFVPFFGTPAATVPMASRLAKVTHARVCFCVTQMTPDGYVVHISNLWEGFPTEDFEADTRRITAELESWIRKFPDQYLWTHRRFKTRPEGETSVY